jgi:hypothetical protein
LTHRRVLQWLCARRRRRQLLARMRWSCLALLALMRWRCLALLLLLVLQ